MNWKNSKKSYGFIAKTLHWGTAIMFLAAYVRFYYRHWFTDAKTPENWNALQIHLSIGVSLGVFVLLRIIWRLMDNQPRPEPGSALEHRLAKLGHLALYAVMIIMPITGYLGTGANTDYFFLFEIPKFSDTWLFSQLIEQNLGIDFQTLEKPMDFIHKQILGAWLAWVLIGGHIAAALYHHFIKQDNTLGKMTGIK
jgi:cytochrome b561